MLAHLINNIASSEILLRNESSSADSGSARLVGYGNAILHHRELLDLNVHGGRRIVIIVTYRSIRMKLRLENKSVKRARLTHHTVLQLQSRDSSVENSRSDRITRHE